MKPKKKDIYADDEDLRNGIQVSKNRGYNEAIDDVNIWLKEVEKEIKITINCFLPDVGFWTGKAIATLKKPLIKALEERLK